MYTSGLEKDPVFELKPVTLALSIGSRLSPPKFGSCCHVTNGQVEGM